MTINVSGMIKKVMGWCPNASMIETRKSIQFDDPMASVPDRGGESVHNPAGWMNKYRNRNLFVSFITTLAAINFFTFEGIKENMGLFSAGLILGSITCIITGIAEWRRLNKAAAGEFGRLQITRKKMILNYLIIAGFIAVFAFVTGFLLVKTETHIRSYYAFLSGLFLFAWTQYLEVIYWEKKNGKILIMNKTSFYGVDIGQVAVNEECN